MNKKEKLKLAYKLEDSARCYYGFCGDKPDKLQIAYRQITKSIRLHPNCVDAIMLKSHILCDMGNDRRSLYYLKKVLALHPPKSYLSEIYSDIADCFRWKGKRSNKKALMYLNMALRHLKYAYKYLPDKHAYDDKAEIYLSKAFVLHELEKHNAALSTLNEGKRKFPKSKEIRNEIKQILATMKQKE